MKELIIHRERNRYDIMLILMCWLMAAGLFGGFLQPVRVLIFLLTPFFVNDAIRSELHIVPPLREVPSYRYEQICFVLWGCYAAISLYWAIDMLESTKAFLHLIINFIGFGEFLWLASKAQKPQQSVIIGWALMFLTTVPIALHELITDEHLPMSLQESDYSIKFGGSIAEVRRFASVTFGNLNTYNVVLCMTFCTMMVCTLRDTFKERFFGYLMMISIAVLIVVNSSRAAFICLAFGILIYILVLMRKRHHVILLLGGIVTAAGILIYRYADLFSFVIMRFQTQGLEDVGRLGVLTHGIEELIRTYGLGIGIGNFIPTMLNEYHLDIAAPHNLLLEVGVQFGVIILLLFIGMFVRVYKRSKKGTIFNRSSAILTILPFIPISIIDSGYILKVPTWIFFATIYVLAYSNYNDNKIND